MDQYIGRLLDDRYEILEIIGTGGMAVVYKARDHRLNRLVAVKILKDEFARDEEFRRRFRAEGEAVAMLSHPNIVQVYDVSASDSANYIVMELIDGISLKQYMEKKGVLNWKETLHFAMQIAKGLEHAHSRGIIHRDIKPHNVMVLKNGSVKVMDFGIARVMSKSNTLTKEALGSVHYISPEQAKGGHTDNRSDIYSLAVVMYEMMTGRPPYDGESPVAVAIQHINGGAPLPSTLNPNIPRGLEQIIMKGMALEVNDRYVSATEMLHDMEEFRQNPDMIFDYHSIVDDATRVLPNLSRGMTTAEKKVQAKTGTAPARTSSDSIHLHQNAQAGRDNESIRRAQQRRQAQKDALAKMNQKVTLDNLFAKMQEGEMKELPLIVKADVQGSAEALKSSLEKISNEEVRVRVIHAGVGAINESDILLASTAGAIVVGFNVRPDAAAAASAHRANVDMRFYRVIYDAIDEIEAAMKGMLAPKFEEVVIGHAEVRMTYKVSAIGTIAGCMVKDGKVTRDSQVRVLRDNIVIHEGEIGSLQRFKDAVKEVTAGYECGMSVVKYNDIKEGDIFECFVMQEVKR